MDIVKNVIKFMIFISFYLILWGFFDLSEHRAHLAFHLIIFNYVSMLAVGFLHGL